MSFQDLVAQETISSQDLCLHHLIDAHAERSPQAFAIAGPGRTPLSYRRLSDHIHEVIGTLNAIGVGRNDRVAIVLPNGPEMAVAFLSVACCATSAPLNPAYRANEFDFCLSDMKAKALMIQSDLDSPARAIAQLRAIPIIELSPVLEEEAGIFTLAGSGSSPSGSCGLAQPDDVALVLHTSGTTSRPKLVPLTQSNLCTSAHNIRTALELVEGDRCLNVMPLFHSHGLVGAVLSSLVAGASVSCCPGFYVSKFFEWLEEVRPTWYTAVPTMHQAILTRASAHSEIIGQNRLRFIRSASASLPAQVMATLEDVFKTPVIEAYGMTEASQIASNPLPPGVRKPGSVGVAAGPQVAIMDEAGKLLSRGVTGEIVIRGANVMRGYENNPAANESAFTNCWFRSGDRGYLDSDGYLFIVGRLMETINRGGEKISPREIDEVLLDHPAVAEAVTFALPDSKLGEDVAAAVVLYDDAFAIEREIREFAAGRLADFKVPRQVLILDEIPKAATGKIQRIGLADQLGISDTTNRQSKQSFTAPSTPLENKIVQIWSDILGLTKVGVHDNFFDLGGDSILATQVVSRLRDTFRVDLSLVLFLQEPTVRGLAESIEKSKREGGGAQAWPIKPTPRGVNLPLSFAQERLWFLNQLEPSSVAYNVLRAVRVRGPLKVEVIEQSLNEIIRRHESLRTTFKAVDGIPFQVITPEMTLALPIIDLRDLLESEREAAARCLAAEQARRPFDLTQGPLFRVTLLKIGDEEHVMTFTIHHTISDGWSMGVLFRELSQLYEAFSAGKSSPLSALPIQYADFAVWQRESLKGNALQTRLSYWKEQLDDAPRTLQLPTDHQRLPVQTYRGSIRSLTLSKSLSAELAKLSVRHKATLFVTLLAAFKTLLHRYTAQEDIVVGTPIANRNRSEFEGMIGFFANTLVLRTSLSGSPSFLELLSRVREVALRAYEHQDLPFERLVEELQPYRNPSHSPLFQVMFALQNLPMQVLSLPLLDTSFIELHNGTSKFELSLSIRESDDGLRCSMEYNTNLFDEVTIERMLSHYGILLEAITVDPDLSIDTLPLLTEPERQMMLVEWNDTKTEYPGDRRIHRLFEEQVERTPDALAVVFEEKMLTYREINTRANQLAHYLLSAGVGPEVPVGICLERSLEMIVAVLAVLKAGGAYVPIDPSYPKKRLEFMLEDSRIKVLLTQSVALDRLPRHRIDVVSLDSDWKDIATNSKGNPIVSVSSDNIAYVLYTSGSTGNPKGVQIPHRSLTNFINSASDHLALTSSDVVSAVTTFSFDISVFDIFTALITGARIELVSRDIATDGVQLSRMINKSSATIMNATPSTWKILMTVDRRSQNELKILSGGEELTRDLANLLLERSKSLWNVYGPVETTVYCTFYRVISQPGSVPIGRPISNTQIYIIDKGYNLVPIGVTGELHIGGRGLARGYLNRAELTAEKFIPSPFGKEPGERVYTTGDLARYLPDGNIEFLGRIDNQVKIRGFRVEPGEVEIVLAEHPAVHDCVVLAGDSNLRHDSLSLSAGKRLIAYVIPSNGSPLSIGDLRTYLKQKLPEYMLPAAFVIMDSFPLTPNGKVDREALPVPDDSRPDVPSAYVPPGNPVEEVLAEIWAEVLRIDRVGIRDDFFELGGHSLVATQVVARIRTIFQVDFPLRHMFDIPTIEGLALALFNNSNDQVTIERTAQLFLTGSEHPEDEEQSVLDRHNKLESDTRTK